MILSCPGAVDVIEGLKILAVSSDVFGLIPGVCSVGLIVSLLSMAIQLSPYNTGKRISVIRLLLFGKLVFRESGSTCFT